MLGEADDADGVTIGSRATESNCRYFSAGARDILDDHVDVVRKISSQERRKQARLKIKAPSRLKGTMMVMLLAGHDPSNCRRTQQASKANMATHSITLSHGCLIVFCRSHYL